MTAPESVLLLYPSGVVLRVDVPRGEHELLRHNDAIESGHVSIVDEKDVVEQETRHGGTILVVKKAEKPKAAAKKAASAPAPSDD